MKNIERERKKDVEHGDKEREMKNMEIKKER